MHFKEEHVVEGGTPSISLQNLSTSSCSTMQRLSMNPGGPTSEEAKQLEEEEAAMTKWNMISSIVAFGAIVLVLRVGKQNQRQIDMNS